MISLGRLVDKVKNTLHLNLHPKCKHTFKNNGQVWVKAEGKTFKLKNRVTCTSCKDDLLEDIGEK